MARQVRWCIAFVDLKFPSSISGPIEPCKYFTAACVTSQIILNFFFLNMHACANYEGFCWDGHIYTINRLHLPRYVSQTIKFYVAGLVAS